MCKMCGDSDQYQRVKTYINDYATKHKDSLNVETLAKFYVLPVDDVNSLLGTHPDLMDDIKKHGQWKP